MARTCAYLNCGRSKRTAPTIRSFYFPISDPDRCEKWIINSGNADLLVLPPEKLKKRFVCDAHFRKEDFLAKYLTKSAVPLPYSQQSDKTSLHITAKQYGPMKEPQPSTSKILLKNQELVLLTPPKRTSKVLQENEAIEDENMSVLIDISNMPSPSKRSKPTIAEAAQELKTRLSRTERHVQILKRKLKVRTTLSSARSINSLPTLPRALTRMQLYHNKRTVWLPDERSTALSLIYKSPSTYKFLRRKGVVLPSPSIISKWLRKYDCRPGIRKHILKYVKLKVDTMTEKTKQCVLLFDEMAIKQCLQFSRNKGIIEGFEDLGDLGRKPYLAKQALVFLVRGIYSDWKLPLSFYFTTSGVAAQDLQSILLSNLQALSEIGLNPISITCDQSSSNQKLFKLLDISVDRPYFIFNKRKYFALFDVPHLVKSIRNNLLDGDFTYHNKTISFKDIQAVYAIDKTSKTGRALPKLTDTHMNPNNFQKMNVRLAVQVLSDSVSAAIRTARETGELKSGTAENTASFIKLINDTFDVLNSRSLKSKKIYCRALSDMNVNWMQLLESTCEIMKVIKKVVAKNKFRRPPCFDGVLLTISGIKQIFEIQKDKGFPFLLTSRLNQDVLENQFSIYRQRGGYLRNPTVRLFQAAFKANAVHNLLMPPKTSNYEESTADKNLILLDSNIDTESTCSESPTIILSSSSSSCSSVCQPLEHEATIEDCSVVYFAGYLVKKCLDQYACTNCKETLSQEAILTNQNDILLFYKNYNINDPVSLKKPSELQLKAVKVAMRTFSKYFKLVWTKRKFAEVLYTKIVNRLKKVVPHWCMLTECDAHRNYILNFLVRVLTYKECQSISATIKAKTTKPSEKLTLQHK